MIPQVVVDVGNTRVKWGQIAPEGKSIARTISLEEDPEVWDRVAEAWALPRPSSWVLASVRPSRSERLASWATKRGDHVVRLEKAAQLPLEVNLPMPDHVGIDRLLDAVAARRVLDSGRAAVLIDAGSAVTLDYLDERGAFCGGAIYPGIDLMSQALNQYTALLPRVEVTHPLPTLPAKDTSSAMQIGIFLAVSGGIREAVRLYASLTERSPRVIFTGGQAPLLIRGMGLGEGSLPEPWSDYLLWPEQTLIGILDSVEAAP